MFENLFTPEKPKAGGVATKEKKLMFEGLFEPKATPPVLKTEEPIVEKPKESIFKKALKFVLPRKVEEMVGLAPKPEWIPLEPSKAPEAELRVAQPMAPEKDTLFEKAARFVLPKSLEVKFKLRKPTTAEEIKEWGKDEK